MKTEDLLNLISDADPESVKEAGEYDIRTDKPEITHKPNRRMKWILPAVCVASAALAVIAVLLFRSGRTTVNDNGIQNTETTGVTTEISPHATKAEVIRVEASYPASVGKELSLQEFMDSGAQQEWLNEKLASIDADSGLESSINSYYSTIMQKLLTGTDENTVCSPLNTYVAFAMLAEITSGESRNQVLKMLNISDMETLRKNVKNLWETNYADTPAAQSLLANSVWLTNTIKYNDNTLKTLAEQYYASSFCGVPGSTEFDEALQKWTDDNTGNLLSDYSKEMTIPEEMVMQLVSTIYFKAQWTEPFESEKTSESVFHGTKKETKVNMMHKEKNAFAYVTNNFTQVTLGLTNGGAMHFYLPQPGVDVNTLVSDPEVLNAVTGNENLLYAEIKMSIPKFKISGTQDLSETMKELGVTDVFDYTVSDFTPITDELNELFLSKADHAAMVEIDEQGVTGTAYTAITVEMQSLPKETIDFNLDRPFMFMITGPDGSVLFSGIVRNIE